MKTILFLLVEFPPINQAGVFRPLRFINACAEKGYKVIIVTVKFDKNLNWPVSNLDFDLLEKVNKNVTIIRVPTENLEKFDKKNSQSIFRTLLKLNDSYSFIWKKNLEKNLPNIFEIYKPSLLVTSIPPFSIANLAKKISLKYKLPLLLDVRDAWSQLSIVPNASILHYQIKKYQERSCFKLAKKITSVTPQLLKMLQKNHPNVYANKFVNIFNSPNELIGGIKNHEIKAKKLQLKEKLNIGYTGTFYIDKEAYQKSKVKWYKRNIKSWLYYYPINEDWLYRTPYFFFQSLAQLIKHNPEYENKICFHHIGKKENWIYEFREQFDLKIEILSHGYCNQQEVSRLEGECDYLLTTSEKVMGEEHYCLPSKLFSYIKRSKPIIGFVSEGIQKEFIDNSNAGITFNPDNLEESSVKLKELFEKGFQKTLNINYLNKFDLQNTNNEFLNLVEQTIKIYSK